MAVLCTAKDFLQLICGLAPGVRPNRQSKRPDFRSDNRHDVIVAHCFSISRGREGGSQRALARLACLPSASRERDVEYWIAIAIDCGSLLFRVELHSWFHMARNATHPFLFRSEPGNMIGRDEMS